MVQRCSRRSRLVACSAGGSGRERSAASRAWRSVAACASHAGPCHSQSLHCHNQIMSFTRSERDLPVGPEIGLVYKRLSACDEQRSDGQMIRLMSTALSTE